MNAKLSPAMVKDWGYKYVVVPTKSIYPSYHPAAFKHWAEACKHAASWFTHGSTIYTVEGYKAAWLEGVV